MRLLITQLLELQSAGLDTNNRYSILKLDDNRFRLIDVGVGGTVTTDVTRSKTVDFTSVGIGTQVFQYPPITVDVNVSYGSHLVDHLHLHQSLPVRLNLHIFMKKELVMDQIL